jgi:hypothetical protein
MPRLRLQGDGSIVAGFHIELLYRVEEDGLHHMVGVEFVCDSCGASFDGLHPHPIRRLKAHTRSAHWPTEVAAP